MYSILCLSLKTTVTSLSASKGKRNRKHPLCVNTSIPFRARVKTQELCAGYQASYSVPGADVTVVLDVRQKCKLIDITRINRTVHFNTESYLLNSGII